MPKVQVFKIQVAFNFYDKINKFNKDNKISNINFSKVPERFCLKYRDFFNIYKVEYQLSY